MAMGITAALKLGDITLLGRESKDVQDALSSTHQSKRFIIDYLQAYSKGAKLHLGDAAGIIVNWLGDLVSG
jgi:hypothetical protein